MYSNTVTLIGFLGGDPDRRQTKNNNTFTVLSLATKTSWKNKKLASGNREPSGIARLPTASWPTSRRRSRKARMCKPRVSFVAASTRSRSKARRK